MSIITPKLEGKAWSTFLEVELAPATKLLYGRCVQDFMKYCVVKNPDRLLYLGTVQQTEDKVIAWLGSLKDEGKATATMRTALASLVFFYSCNRITLNSKFIATKLAMPVVEGSLIIPVKRNSCCPAHQ